MMTMASRCFQEVTVGFPAGSASGGKLDDWQGVNWVFWSTGELRVDSSSFALVFLPGGPLRGNLSAKPLGCLLSAAPILTEGGAHAFVVKTNDPVHSLICFGFRSPADEEAFSCLAGAAEVAPARYAGSSRRSSLGAADSLREDAAAQQLAAAIRQQHPGRCPAIFTGAELYGPDPHGERGSEVLVGRGALVLLDGGDQCRVGPHELLFYEEGDGRAVLQVTVGARTRLTPQPQEASCRLSVARRLSARPCMAASFDFTVSGETGWSLAFDAEEEAEAFARDLRLRQQLVELSLRAWRGKQLLSGLQEDITRMRQSGLLAAVRRWLLQLLLVILCGLLGYAAILYNESPQRPLGDIAWDALGDAGAAAGGVAGFAADAGVGLCQLLARAPPAHSLELCLTLPDGGELRSCVASLLGS